MVAKGDCPMVRVISLDQYMAVESPHLRNGKYANSAKGSGGNRQHLALGDIAAELIVGSGLQTVKGNISGHNISLQSTVGHLHRKRSCHDHLVLHAAESQFSGAGISTVEAHKGVLVGIIEFLLDRFLIHIFRNGVVDVKESYHIIAHCRADKLA